MGFTTEAWALFWLPSENAGKLIRFMSTSCGVTDPLAEEEVQSNFIEEEYLSPEGGGIQLQEKKSPAHINHRRIGN